MRRQAQWQNPVYQRRANNFNHILSEPVPVCPLSRRARAALDVVAGKSKLVLAQALALRSGSAP